MFRPLPSEGDLFFELGFQIIEVLSGFLVKMGGGNGQKAKMAREKNMEKLKAAKGEFSLSNSSPLFIDNSFFFVVLLLISEWISN